MCERIRNATCIRHQGGDRLNQCREQRQFGGEPFRILIQAKGVVQDRNRDLVAAKRALQRIALDAFDQVAAPYDQAGLDGTEQLVAAERDDVGAVCQRFGDGGFVRQAKASEVDQRAAAEIDNERQVPFMRDGGERRRRDAARKSLDPVVARMHFEQEGRGFVDRAVRSRSGAYDLSCRLRGCDNPNVR